MRANVAFAKSAFLVLSIHQPDTHVNTNSMKTGIDKTASERVGGLVF